MTSPWHWNIRCSGIFFFFFFSCNPSLVIPWIDLLVPILSALSCFPNWFQSVCMVGKMGKEKGGLIMNATPPLLLSLAFQWIHKHTHSPEAVSESPVLYSKTVCLVFSIFMILLFMSWNSIGKKKLIAFQTVWRIFCMIFTLWQSYGCLFRLLWQRWQRVSWLMWVVKGIGSADHKGRSLSIRDWKLL